MLEMTGEDNYVSADASGVAADTCFKSRECNLRESFSFLSVTGKLLHLEPIEMLQFLTDTDSA